MSKRVGYLIIDAQIDFCDLPGAALPVPNATKDLDRIAESIEKEDPSAIFSTFDSHYSLDIAHPSWWMNHKGGTVNPFTIITPEDIRNGVYAARIDPVRSLKYLDDLKANGEFQHMIWPEHCLIGSEGHALYPPYLRAINTWMHKNKRWANFVEKGVNPNTEHFGCFRANVPIPEDPNTQINQGIFQALNSLDLIRVGGQAWTHCMINSIMQMLDIAPQLAPKVVIHSDWSSPVTGLPQDFYDHVDKLYKKAESIGATICKSTS